MSAVSVRNTFSKGILSDSPRLGEASDTPPARSKRFYFNGEAWYFRTRGNTPQGPFTTYMEAESALKLYLRRCGVVRYTL